jgi:hypothetical protein
MSKDKDGVYSITGTCPPVYFSRVGRDGGGLKGTMMFMDMPSLTSPTDKFDLMYREMSSDTIFAPDSLSVLGENEKGGNVNVMWNDDDMTKTKDLDALVTRASDFGNSFLVPLRYACKGAQRLDVSVGQNNYQYLKAGSRISMDKDRAHTKYVPVSSVTTIGVSLAVDDLESEASCGMLWPSTMFTQTDYIPNVADSFFTLTEDDVNNPPAEWKLTSAQLKAPWPYGYGCQEYPCKVWRAIKGPGDNAGPLRDTATTPWRPSHLDTSMWVSYSAPNRVRQTFKEQMRPASITIAGIGGAWSTASLVMLMFFSAVSQPIAGKKGTKQTTFTFRGHKVKGGEKEAELASLEELSQKLEHLSPQNVQAVLAILKHLPAGDSNGPVPAGKLEQRLAEPAKADSAV